jgi:FHA domain
MEQTSRRLALIEQQGRDGRPWRMVDVAAWPLTIGRALDNDLVLDDAFVAPHHATLEQGSSGALQLRVGDTFNGAQLEGQHLNAGDVRPLPQQGGTLQLGHSVLRLRLAAEILSPERRLPRAGPLPRWAPALAAVLIMLWATLENWTRLDPGADTSAWLPLLLGLPVALLLWCGLWALLSKLFQHRFDLVGHLKIVLPWLVAIELLELVLLPLSASMAWPWLWRSVPMLQVLLAAMLLRHHLVHVLPHAPHRVSAVVATATLAAGAISLAATHRATDRFSRPPYMSTLPLPMLPMAGAQATTVLADDLAPIAERLAERVRRAREEDKGEADDES